MGFTKFAFLSLLSLAVARDATQRPAEDPLLGQITSQGCFSSRPGGASGRSQIFNSIGTCGNYCKGLNKPVAILKGSQCLCAYMYPASNARVDDDQCDTPCPGFAPEACGGRDAYSVLNTGLEYAIENDGGDSTGITTATRSTAAKTSHATSTTLSEQTSAPTTKSEQDTTSVTKAEHASPTADATIDTTAPSTPRPSASTVANNASRRLSSPIGNIIGMVPRRLGQIFQKASLK